jgi:hypothetical protein
MIKHNYVGQYLIHSYLYYICNRPVISDEEFDKICKHLLDNWDDINHMHKHLLCREDLQAGTGFAIKYDDYPEIVKSCATRLYQKKYNTQQEDLA